MNESMNRTYTAEEFRAICREAVPYMEGLLELAKRNGIGGYVRISVNADDGYASLDSLGFSGWSLDKLGDGEGHKARYSYSEKFTMEEAQS